MKNYIIGFDEYVPETGNTAFTAYARALAKQINEPEPKTFPEMLNTIKTNSGDTSVTLLYENKFTALVLSIDSHITVLNIVDKQNATITNSYEINA